MIGSLILAVEQVFNWILGYGFKTDAQYYHNASDVIKFCSNFIVSDGGLKLSVNQEKKSTLTDLDVEEIFTRLSSDIKSKIETIDLSGVKNISYKTLLAIGNALPNLVHIKFQDCKYLMENDDIKGYFQAFFSTKRFMVNHLIKEFLNRLEKIISIWVRNPITPRSKNIIWQNSTH